MFHPQYWTTRVPTSPFEQTLYEADQVFYATFPAAREAAYNAVLEQHPYEPPRSTDSALLEDAQPLEYDIRNEQELDISCTSVPLSGPTQEPSYPLSHFDYSTGLHSQEPSPPLYRSQPSYYSPPPLPIENEAPVYVPSNQPYNHQYSSNPMSSHIPPSSPSLGTRELTFLVNQPLDTGISTRVNTDIHQQPIGDGRPLESPRHGFRQLNRHMKPPTLKFTNNCQLAVMRLDRLSDHGQKIDSPKHSDQSCASASNTSVDTPCQTTPTPTEFLLNSAKSPSIGLSSLPAKNLPERKPPLACLFCRGRKIACGPPLPGSIKKTCNQCRKRSLQCHYPSESRRGMRKKKPPSATTKIKSQK